MNDEVGDGVSAPARPGTTSPPARVSLVERAYRELRRRILDNELPAGFQATEAELAAELRMSRTPLREALIRLEQDGLVEVRPRHGMRVLPVSAEDMREIYEILTALESSAAASVAERGADAQALAPLEAAVDDMDKALEADDLVAWARADERFHNGLVALCGNRRLADLIATFLAQTHRARMVTLRLRPKPVASNVDHRRLLEALAAGDAEAAAAIHREHRRRNGALLVNLLRQYGLRQV